MGLALAVNKDEITHPSGREAAPSAFALYWWEFPSKLPLDS